MNAPIPGKYLFKALMEQNTIVLAANTRIVRGVAKGIFKAAKELDAALIIEIARSECNVNKGYTGLEPSGFAELVFEASGEVGHDIWVLHADHIGLKKGTEEDIAAAKVLIKSQINAGFTSFAIDASHLFDFGGATVREELAPNIKATVELGRYIRDNYGSNDFGLEVEVGEIGRKNEDGMILTTPQEAVIFIRALNEEGLYPQVIAIANGSAHGNIYDGSGKLIEQISIDIARTKEIAAALKANGLNVRIAQHGITGTPLPLISSHFPHESIVKGNVGTFWQNIYHETLKQHDPALFRDMWDWTVDTYKDRMEVENIKNHDQLFGKYGKFATGQFFTRIYDMDAATEQALEARAHHEALRFFQAFKAENTAALVRAYIREQT